MIIQNQIVLGLEAVEGTDNLMIRCKDYKKSGDKGILVKFQNIIKVIFWIFPLLEKRL